MTDTLKNFPAGEDLDAQRELARAAKRIVLLEKALKRILEAPCDARGTSVLATACTCCLHDRMVARAALDGVE